jgi:hypothetical protein
MFIIVVPYRDRDLFLKQLLERIPEYLKDKSDDYKIIISEQNDEFNFNNALSKNIGAAWANQNFNNITHFIFNEVDTVPIKDVDYTTPENIVHFMNFGSSKIIKNDFFKINGYNPLYNGWGHEDSDFFERYSVFDIPHKQQFDWKDKVGIVYDNLEHIYYGKFDRTKKWDIQKLTERNLKMFDFFRNLNKPLKQYWASINGVNLIDINKIKFLDNFNNKVYHISYNSADCF